MELASPSRQSRLTTIEPGECLRSGVRSAARAPSTTISAWPTTSAALPATRVRSGRSPMRTSCLAEPKRVATRFGSAKQLVRIGDRPLLTLVAGRAAEVVGHALIVVLGARAADLTPLLKHSPGSMVVNRDWREGLASS